MPDFSHLKKYEVQGTQTAEFPLVDIEGTPILHVLPASEANRGYFNALLRRSRKSAKSVQAGAINAQLIEQNRQEDRELYSQFVVKGWDKVEDATGHKVPFTQENCLSFLEAIPSNIFDDLRSFCNQPRNFISQDFIDAEETSKN